MNGTSSFEWYALRKPVVFTEWGVVSAESCVSANTGKTSSEQCQAAAFAGTVGLFVLALGQWWARAFWWDWTGEPREPTSLDADGKLPLQVRM